MADLLLELFSEEIPARMQKKASEDMKGMITSALKEAGLTFESANAYVTPRRLALVVDGVPAATPDISEERRGPSTSAPEKALEGFMLGAGVTRDQLEEREEKKGTFFYAKIEKPGRAATEVIAEAVEAIVRNFPWPKSQRWGSGSLKWVRPLHSILCVFGGETVELDVDGFNAGNTTRGHRFLAPEEFAVSDFADYQAMLLEHKVVLDSADRAAQIEAEQLHPIYQGEAANAVSPEAIRQFLSSGMDSLIEADELLLTWQEEDRPEVLDTILTDLSSAADAASEAGLLTVKAMALALHQFYQGALAAGVHPEPDLVRSRVMLTKIC